MINAIKQLYLFSQNEVNMADPLNMAQLNLMYCGVFVYDRATD